MRIYQKSESIEQINNFNITNNYWNEFKPMLNVAINWTPDKIISKDSLQDLNLGNYKKMLSVCLENYIYQSHLLIKQIFNQVKDEKPVVIATQNAIHNGCCVVDTKGKQEYLSHFINKNQDIRSSIRKLNDLEHIYQRLTNTKRQSVFNIYFDLD